jgi:MFS family permease
MANSVTVRIVQTSFLRFLCYLVIGLLLAILPSFVHLRLGLTPVWAGIVVSGQYAATLLSRPRAGLMTDFIGPKATVLSGQAACLLSGFCPHQVRQSAVASFSLSFRTGCVNTHLGS